MQSDLKERLRDELDRRNEVAWMNPEQSKEALKNSKYKIIVQERGI
jgi:hypothetical protein